MARMQLEALTAGMKLCKPVRNLNGVLLLREGEILTAKHLEIFKTWGVREADVVREDGTEPDGGGKAGPPPEVLAAVERQIARRFRRVDTAKDPVMAEVKLITARRLAARLAAQRTASAVAPER
jgi:hypothetical protein